MDPVDGLDRALNELVGMIRATATELGIQPTEWSACHAAAATLTMLWCDLVELAPDRLVRAWGAYDLPGARAGLYQRLLAAVESERTSVEELPKGLGR